MSAIYKQFQQAQQQLSNIEAVDYFFAKEMSQSLHCDSLLDNEQNSQIFHLLVALSESLRAGHTCLPLSAIANSHYGYRCDNQGIVMNHGFAFTDEISLAKLLVTVTDIPQQQVIVFHKNKLYLRRYFNFEQELLTFIIDKNEQAKDPSEQVFSQQHIKQCIEQLFPELSSEIAENEKPEQDVDWQKVAVANAINKPLSIIAGGPGTGKTYTVTKLLAALVMLNEKDNSRADKNIALVAPTGKAAQRLSESITKALQGFESLVGQQILAKIPQQAQTLHRLLGVIPNSVNFRHHQGNLLNIDVLLIDEVSMVDLPMMVRVFRALPRHCQVILLGDADQLPSVAAGSVLNDLAPKPHCGFSVENQQYLADITAYKHLYTSRKPTKREHATLAADHLVFLEKSRRFDGEGGIGKVAKHVINGNFKDSWSLLEASGKPSVNSDNNCNALRLLPTKIDNWLAGFVKSYYLPIFKLDTVAEAFKQLQKFRILCATRVGKQGVEALNEQVHNLLVQQGVITAFQTRYRGQPIMINVNNYALGLYNGDIGLMWQNDAGHLMAVFEQANNDYKWVNPARLPQHETVYAMTIHKTQGSEFEHVVLILPDQTDNKLLSRELMYTGITRAKQKLSIASLANVWRHGVNTKTQRYSGIDLYKK
ncbi:MAG: exodeoxyribonuclease V subunit alpha [Colwellia sp.]|nr:exodeoxyribonuclease V subunit alpha [Colwellia sp.]